MIEKECIGKWNNCPEAKTSGICRKDRNCTIEIDCMKVWISCKNN